METGKYETIGKLIAYILVHNGPRPRFLSPLTYQLLVVGPDIVEVCVDDIWDDELRERVKKVIILPEMLKLANEIKSHLKFLGQINHTSVKYMVPRTSDII